MNFLNLFKDDPQDTGIAGVDIYKMDADGKAVEHWDALQFVGNPKDSAPLISLIGPISLAPIQIECSVRLVTHCVATEGHAQDYLLEAISRTLFGIHQ